MATQEAGFACSMEIPLSWPYIILSYDWTGLNFRGHESDPAPTGYAESTGVFTPRCSMLIVAPVPGAIPFWTDYFDAKPVYVVGGPLVYTIETPTTYTHDDKSSSKPWYLHAFYFDPFGTTPVNAQTPQTGLVSIAQAQPTGTTVTWNVTGGGVLVVPQSAAFVLVGAITPTSEGAIKVRASFSIIVDGTTYGPFDDDCEQTPPPSPYSTAAYYSFTGHTPSDMAVTGSSVVENDQEEPFFTHVVSFSQKAYDQYGKAMPNLWIQERFPFFYDEISQWGVEANFEIGSFQLNWTTAGSQVLFLDSPVHAIDGIFGDNIGVVNWPEEHWSGQYSTPFLSMTQRYYAATHDPTIGNYGILIGTYVNSFWTNQVTHVKQ